MEARKQDKHVFVCTEECLLRGYRADSEAKVARPTEFPRCSLDQSMQAKELYTPLTNWQIRILALLPGSPDENISVELFVATLLQDSGCIALGGKTKIEYEALSYCWGEPRFDHELDCNGVCYPITEHLYTALSYLRMEHGVRYLWIDALCINQHNLAERSTQVAKMLSIYQHARQVPVWLGPSGNNTGLVWSYTDRARQAGEVIAWRLQDDGSLSQPRNERTYGEKELNEAHALEIRRSVDDLNSPSLPSEAGEVRICRDHSQALISGLYDLLTRPWYHRLWVIQEIWAARRIQMVSGTHEFNWHLLCQAARVLVPTLEQVFDSFQDPFETFEIGSQEEKLTKNRSDFEVDDLLSVLQRTSSSTCSDPRDQVYAILGMTKVKHGTPESLLSETKPCFPVDYGRSVRDVYIDVIRYCLEASKDLRILEDVANARSRNKSDHIMGHPLEKECLPSWCPNWSVAWRFQKTHQILLRPENREVCDPKTLLPKSSDVLYLPGVHAGRLVKRQPEAPDFLQRTFYIDTSSIQHKSEYWHRYFENFDGFLRRPWIWSESRAQENDLIILTGDFYRPVILRRHQHQDAFMFVDVFPTKYLPSSLPEIEAIHESLETFKLV